MTIDYPNDFFDFKEGVHIPASEIQQWINKCIENLEINTEQNYTTMASGNTKVFVSRYYYNNNSEYYYVIDVANGYSNCSTLD